MTKLVFASLLSLALLSQLPPLHAEVPAQLRAAPVEAAPPSETSAGTNTFVIEPGPNDGTVAFLTSRLLEQLHYSHHPFDDSISGALLDRYLESLDPRHMHFLQSDLDQFERYRTRLDNLTLNRDHYADTRPAFEIFLRFVERLKQRAAYTEELLQNEKFNFDTDERIAIVRRDMPYPKDLADAKMLWRQWLRYEYLQEKLGKDDESKKAKKTAPATNSVVIGDKTVPVEGVHTNEPARPVDLRSIHQQIVETLSHRYRRNLRVFTDWNHEDVLGVYLTALAHVYDPHSDYFNRESLDGFKISMNLELFGIGAQLRSEDGYCKVAQLIPGGPAIGCKQIEAGDFIVAVAQSNLPPVDVVDMNLNKIVQLIRGPKGTEVRLTVVPSMGSSSRRIVTLIRDKIPLEESAAKSKIFESRNARGEKLRLGVIELPSFYAPVDTGEKPVDLASNGGAPSGQYTSVDVARLLAKFKEENVRGVILDLRRNGGGSLEEAIRLTGLFIKKGPVVQAKTSDDSTQVYDDNDASVAYAGPLIVMTSRFSASASEIVAGALQDYGRALIVGDISTHGKGTVQHLQPLRLYMRMADSDTNEPGALKVTIRKFYRASGASTQLKGVLPDIVLPSVLNYLKDIGENSLENPLPWDTTDSTRFEKLNQVQPSLPELLKRSDQRVAADREFAYIREDIERYRETEEDKTVSLNEQVRLKETRENEARAKARDQERLGRPAPEETVYEISLKQADKPGLPPPVQPTNSVALKLAPGTETNRTDLAGAAAPSAAAAGDEEDDPKPPVVDAGLEEAKRILMDYIPLFAKDSPQLATHESR
jgi:carboxyl-terminal processing protease